MLSTEERLKLIDEDVEDVLIEIESSFGVELNVTDIAESVTIGQLFDCVMRKAATPHQSACLSSVAFYRLRTCLAAVSGIDRRSIARGSSLSVLLPWNTRRARLAELRTRSGLRLPRLQPSGRLAVVLMLIALAGSAFFQYTVFRPGFMNWIGAILHGTMWALLLWIGLLIATIPLHREFPRNTRTFEDLVRRAVGANYRKLTEEAGGSTPAQAWLAFRELVACQTQLIVTREMRFPEDIR